MSISSSSGATTVNGSVTTTISGFTLYTPVNASVTANGNIGTVPAGKEWRVIGVSISADMTNGGATNDKLVFTNDGATIFGLDMKSATSATVVNSNSLMASYEAPIAIVSAGKVLAFAGNTACNLTATVIYVERTL